MSAQPIRQSPALSIWFDSNLASEVTSDWFKPEYWRAKQAITGDAKGRGTTYFINHDDTDLVLRHYRRGGLIGKLLTDQYFFTGLHRTRAWRELSLLLKMQSIGLPAPRPVAAQVEKHGLIYRADIITLRIPDARDAHQILLDAELENTIWTAIGSCIKSFHQHQIYHHDLNIHNVMIDKKDEIWLIDFDKCEQKPGESWKAANLARLLRSLRKEKHKHPDYGFAEGHWQALLEGYNREQA